MKQTNKNALVKYLKRTYKNKLVALALFGIGIVSNNFAILLFMSFIATPLFFVNKKYVY
jgi:hypothetical protein